MMAHNNPTKPPTDEEKVDWFLASVKDRAYDSVHANCTEKQLEGTLTFARVIKFYTHRCFQLYPHFQLDDLHNDKSERFEQQRHDDAKQLSRKGERKGYRKRERPRSRQISNPKPQPQPFSPTSQLGNKFKRERQGSITKREIYI
jgi:hypothetical protein